MDADLELSKLSLAYLSLAALIFPDNSVSDDVLEAPRSEVMFVFFRCIHELNVLLPLLHIQMLRKLGKKN